MAKEFNVPPVVFPSSTGGNANTIGPNPTGPHQRRIPTFTPPFQPSNPNPSQHLPFMSFDVGSATASSSFSAPVFSTGNGYSTGMGGGPGSFEDELPLLEELGINTRQIWRKMRSILNPLKVNPNIHADADLSGPFLFLMAFGLFQLLAGKLHFGIILGCVSLVGYCMLPIVIFSALALFVPQGGIAVFVLGAVFVIWATRVCTRLVVELASCGDEHRGLIAYACFLIYTLFSLLVIF